MIANPEIGLSVLYYPTITGRPVRGVIQKIHSYNSVDIIISLANGAKELREKVHLCQGEKNVAFVSDGVATFVD